MRWTTVATINLALLALAAGNAWAQPSTINLDVPGPADWNTATNWIIPNVVDVFVPGDGFPDEVVGISNAGIATLTTPAQFQVFGVVIGETHDPAIPNPTEEDGTLNISGTGQLQLIDPMGGGNAALRIGDAGRGVLNLSAGSVLADSVTVGGAPDSALNLSGTGILAISGSATLGRTARIEGPDTTFDIEGDLTVGGTFIPVITGPTHSAITVASGNAALGGTLQVQFSSYVPTLGDSWTLIDASTVSGVFSTVDISQAAGLPRGATFDVQYDPGGNGNVVIDLANRLVLSVDRGTGTMTLENAIGDPIEIDAYSIGSPSGLLDPNGWQSLQDGAGGTWEEANPSANFLAELDPGGSLTLSVGEAPVSLGNGYGFAPTQLGDPGTDLTFVYSGPNGDVASGIIEYVGPGNNLVLTVDPATGEGVLTNDSKFDVDLLGYSIVSESGSLQPANGAWNSLQDQGQAGWEEANPSANGLNELNPSGVLAMSPGGSVPLGALFDVAGAQDLTLEALYEISGGPLGDTNGDGVVNIDDLNNVRNNFGGGGLGDTNGDGVVNIDDLNNVRNNFGATGGGGGGVQDIVVGVVKYESLGGAPVPEPAAWLLGTLGLVGLATARTRGRRPKA